MRIILWLLCACVACAQTAVHPGAGSSLPATTNLIKGNGSGNGVDSGIDPTKVVTQDANGNVTIGATMPGGAPANSLAVGGNLYAGVGSGVSGAVALSGLTSGTVNVQAQDVAGTWTFKLPATAGSLGYVLSTDGAGVTSWISQSAGSVCGADTQLQYNASSVCGASANLTFSTSANQLTVGPTAANVKMGKVASFNVGEIWFNQASPTSSNYSIAGDGTNTYLNAPTGGVINFEINGGSVLESVAPTVTTFYGVSNIDSSGNARFGQTSTYNLFGTSSDFYINGPTTLHMRAANAEALLATATTLTLPYLASAAKGIVCVTKAGLLYLGNNSGSGVPCP